MRLRDSLRRAAGLLVELPPEEPQPEAEVRPRPAPSKSASELSDLLAQLDDTGPAPTKTVEQIVRDAHGPNLDEIRIPAGTPAPALTPEGQLDFPALYTAAGLPAVPFSAEQMLDMLASLPQELPLDTRRQTVKVTLGALGKSAGATPDTIVADASRKLAALASYAESLAQQTTQTVAAAEQEIAALTARIEAQRRAITEARQRLTQVTEACHAESDRLDDVLEFFSLDVPPSKYAGNAPGGG
jgi:hypothetical protein